MQDYHTFQNSLQVQIHFPILSKNDVTVKNIGIGLHVFVMSHKSCFNYCATQRNETAEYYRQLNVLCQICHIQQSLILPTIGGTISFRLKPTYVLFMQFFSSSSR